MNIYITRENTEKLRQEGSMSGLINRLLEKHYAPLGTDAPSAEKAPRDEVTWVKEEGFAKVIPSGIPNKIEIQSTPKAEQGLCKTHGVPKDVCKMMKHQS